MNTFYFTQRTGARILAVVALFSLVAGMVPMQAFAFGNNNNNDHDDHDNNNQSSKVKICHASDHGYSSGKQEVDKSAVLGGQNAHKNHSDGGFNDIGDIIPPFSSGSTNYPGKNWNAQGQAIWNANCATKGDITVTKVVSGGTAQVSNFALKVGNTSVVSGVKKTGITLGSYKVSETGSPANYTASFTGACDNDGDVTIIPGQSVSCTITNTYVPPVVDVCSNIPDAQATVPQGYYATDGACFPNPVDVCPNIEGPQATVPQGQMINEAGNCVDIPPPPVDVCDNLEGNQASVPDGYVQSGDNCDPVTPTDVCPNIEGPQATVPQGQMINEAGNCVDIPPPPVDVCDNLGGDQATVPQGYVQNGDNCDLIPPPPIDVCSNIIDAQATVPQGYHLEGESTCVPNEANPDPIYGCTDDSAVNYSPRANTDDESCIFDYESQCISETPNLLTNPSFEDPVGLTNNTWGIFTTVNGWAHTLSSGLEIWQNLLITPSHGIQNAELDGDDATKITQTVVTTPGATYELRFDFAARSDSPAAANNHIEAAADGLVINESTDYTNWVTYGGTFTADASTEVSFVDLGTPQDGGGTGTLLDNAVLCLVRVPVVDFCPNIDGNQAVDSYLKDVNGQCYSPITSCSVSVVSDTSNLEGDSAALLATPHPAWLPTITGSLAQWIWGSASDSAISPSIDETQTFTKTFVWSGTPATALLKLAADNGYSVKLNGTTVGGDAGEFNYSSTDTIVDLTDNVIQGVNTLEVSVTNKANGATTLSIEDGNPAGLLYDLTITNNTGDCAPDGGGDDNERTYRIQGYVWHDNNRNADWDGHDDDQEGDEEEPVSGWEVRITNGDGDDRTTITDANGLYYFDVPAGTWTITEDESGHWFRTTAQESYVVTVPGEQVTFLDSVINFIIPTAYAADLEVIMIDRTYGDFNFGNDRRSGGGGGGTHLDRTPDGEVLGDSDDAGPEGQVLGEQVDAVPAGAPNTGKGGAASTLVASRLLVAPRRIRYTI